VRVNAVLREVHGQITTLKDRLGRSEDSDSERVTRRDMKLKSGKPRPAFGREGVRLRTGESSNFQS
jgi:hypothetical protein